MRPETTSKPESPSARLPITARALLETRRLSDPKLHPDGVHVAFVAGEADFDESRWISHIWMTEWMNCEPEGEAPAEPGGEAAPAPAAANPENAPDGRHDEPEDPTRQLTFSRDGEYRPRWSPDGRSLAFVSARVDETEPPPEDEDIEEPREQIWVLPGEGGEARRVTNTPEGVIDYDWLPDSRTIVFVAPEARPRAIESARRELRGRRKVDPTVEHDDRRRRQLWRIDTDERKPHRLWAGDFGIEEIAVSPDGARIACITNRTGEWDDYHFGDIWLVETETGAARLLTDRPGGKGSLRWSPDSSQLAFLSWLDPDLSYSRQSVFVVDAPATPSEQQPVPRLIEPQGFDIDVMDLQWRRGDGQLIVIGAVGAGSALIRISETEFEILHELTGEIQDLDADIESPVLIYVAESDETLSEIHLLDPEAPAGEREIPLTSLHRDFLETYRLPKQETVRWTGRDGTPLEGVLTYPLDYAEGRAYPLALQLHGGPKGRATRVLCDYYLAPVWSAEGYLVFNPNYRGSEGYGNAFAIANRRDLGGADFEDAISGVDWLIERGLADPDRLGIMGGSYGAFLANWAIGHSQRFKAAVSMFGIFNLQSDYSSSELPRWDTEYLGAYYWQEPELYRRLSPASYVDSIRTPTLVIHGDEDPNTFISNSKELYRALRHRGIVTQFVHYPREGHGLREPNHRLDEISRCLAWMDRYLLAPEGRYRAGDRVPSSNGMLELCVHSVEMAVLVGLASPESAEPRSPATGRQEGQRTAGAADAARRLEIAFHIHNPNSAAAAEPYALRVSDILLVPHRDFTPTETDSGMARPPSGVPLDVCGARVLIEGDGIRTIQHPDPETGQLAFGFAVLFSVPASGADWQLRIPGFPPVLVSWSDSSAEKDSPPASPNPRI
jgi:dipeptidyl aminopeptidase/acylaminoacyl peptidase